jgi:hypothetical protein
MGAVVHGGAAAGGDREVHRRCARRPGGGEDAAVGRARAVVRHDCRVNAVSRHRGGDRSRGDRLHLVRSEMAAEQSEYGVQAAAALARVRDARLPGGRAEDGQLQLRLAESDRATWCQEGRCDSASPASARWNGARQCDVQHPFVGMEGREAASRVAHGKARQRRDPASKAYFWGG